MRLFDQVDFARVMTGSKLSNEEIIREALNLTTEQKKAICPELDEMFEKCGMSFEEAFTAIEDKFNEVAARNQMDPALLFWIYLNWEEESEASSDWSSPHQSCRN
ncbi:MAG: hypothetical protein ABRQ23_00730 [Syntrophomonadaceae bacterium]